MISKSFIAVTFLLLILFACNPNQEKYEKLFDIYYEKYPNIYDPFTQQEQQPQSPYQQYEAGNYPIALTGFDSLLQLDPQQNFAKFYQGLSYFEMEQYKSSISPLQDAIDSQSNLIVAPALFYSALSYLKLGRKEDALRQLKQIRRKHDYYYPRAQELMSLIDD